MLRVIFIIASVLLSLPLFARQIDARLAELTMQKYFDSTVITTPWTLKEYKDLNLYLDLKSLDRQLSLMIDHGYYLGKYQRYGLIPKGKGQIKIDKSLYPRWLTVDQLFLHFHQLEPSEYELYQAELIQMGFSQSEFDKLVSYISLTDIAEQSAVIERKVNKQFIAKIAKNYHQKIDNTDLIVQWGFELKKQTDRLHRDWAVGLLNQFNNHKQRILIEDAHRHIHSSTRTATPVTSDYVHRIEQMIVDKDGVFNKWIPK